MPLQATITLLDQALAVRYEETAADDPSRAEIADAAAAVGRLVTGVDFPDQAGRAGSPIRLMNRPTQPPRRSRIGSTRRPLWNNVRTPPSGGSSGGCWGCER